MDYLIMCGMSALLGGGVMFLIGHHFGFREGTKQITSAGYTSRAITLGEGSEKRTYYIMEEVYHKNNYFSVHHIEEYLRTRKDWHFDSRKGIVFHD